MTSTRYCLRWRLLWHASVELKHNIYIYTPTVETCQVYLHWKRYYMCHTTIQQSIHQWSQHCFFPPTNVTTIDRSKCLNPNSFLQKWFYKNKENGTKMFKPKFRRKLFGWLQCLMTLCDWVVILFLQQHWFYQGHQIISKAVTQWNHIKSSYTK